MANLRNLSIFVLLLAVLGACKKDDNVHIHPVEIDVILPDVAYGSDAKQRMDIYLPAGRSMSNTKFVVLIHGGGWIGGDKGDFGINEDALLVLKDQFPGFALINLNYRLASNGTNTYPTAENDVKAAMDFIYRNLRSYQLSSSNYIIGGSAGAHLAALYTLKNNEPSLQGCVAISGAYDLEALYHSDHPEAKEVVTTFMGGSPTDKPTQYQQASPIHFVNANGPKFLILHGTEDDLVPVLQATEFKSALEAEGVATTYFSYSGGHGIPPHALEGAFTHFKDFIK